MQILHVVQSDYLKLKFFDIFLQDIEYILVTFIFKKSNKAIKVRNYLKKYNIPTNTVISNLTQNRTKK